jgi:hypothetical protein
VRLAYEQGLLQGRSLNPFQKWALRYHMSVKRWFLSEIEESLVKSMAFVFNPQRFTELFVDSEPESEPIGPDEFDSIERYLQTQGQVRHSASGGEITELEEEGWI